MEMGRVRALVYPTVANGVTVQAQAKEMNSMVSATAIVTDSVGAIARAVIRSKSGIDVDADEFELNGVSG